MAQTDYMTLAEFKRDFPEYRSSWSECSDMVSSYLAKAEQRLDPAELGDKLNQAHGLLTAHLLALSPFGQQSRLLSDKGSSTYGIQLRELLSQTVLGVTVSGGLGSVEPCP